MEISVSLTRSKDESERNQREKDVSLFLKISRDSYSTNGITSCFANIC